MGPVSLSPLAMEDKFSILPTDRYVHKLLNQRVKISEEVAYLNRLWGS